MTALDVLAPEPPAIPPAIAEFAVRRLAQLEDNLRELAGRLDQRIADVDPTSYVGGYLDGQADAARYVRDALDVGPLDGIDLQLVRRDDLHRRQAVSRQAVSIDGGAMG